MRRNTQALIQVSKGKANGDYFYSVLNTQNRQEGSNINKSLLALSTCINLLSKSQAYIPYRDSKLTRILKDSLGGNCYTLFLACIDQNPLNTANTVNTLKYACRAKMIKNSLELNQKGDEELYKAIVENLKEQAESLRGKIEAVKSKERSDRRRFLRQRAFSEPKIDTKVNELKGEMRLRREMKGKFLIFKDEIKELKKRIEVENNGIQDFEINDKVKSVFGDVRNQVYLINTGHRDFQLDQKIEQNLDEFKEQAKD